MEKKNSYTIKLTSEQMEQTARILREGNYRPRRLAYTLAAVEGEDCQIAVYQSGKCLVQGKGAADWITFVLEPQVLGEARLGYEDVLNPDAIAPHIGVDESGKGDYFGPLVIAAAYVDPAIANDLRAMNVRDSKTITSDKAAQEIARKIRERLGDQFTVVSIGPSAYNRLYATMGSVNRILAWGHARAIENLLEKVPGCPRALSDQFGPEQQIQRALQKKGRRIKLEQRHKAESDVAVAAASILARAGFLSAMDKLGATYGVTLPKGASEKVKAVAAELVEKKGGAVLLETAKCHFKTTDDVLAPLGRTRLGEGLPPAPARKVYVHAKSPPRSSPRASAMLFDGDSP
ncbi:MAG: ribonuclease HIII [Verrucomicrobiota bacterium]|jgi:ribonuclease HIII|nr:ribonuclease HIII [Verrucomicrobiota bacterium]